eukprot:SM000137S00479  [mRNA]  locus=s137:316438:321373:- [translate_table: standard]
MLLEERERRAEAAEEAEEAAAEAEEAAVEVAEAATTAAAAADDAGEEGGDHKLLTQEPDDWPRGGGHGGGVEEAAGEGRRVQEQEPQAAAEEGGEERGEEGNGRAAQSEAADEADDEGEDGKAEDGYGGAASTGARERPDDATDAVAEGGAAGGGAEGGGVEGGDGDTGGGGNRGGVVLEHEGKAEAEEEEEEEDGKEGEEGGGNDAKDSDAAEEEEEKASAAANLGSSGGEDNGRDGSGDAAGDGQGGEVVEGDAEEGESGKEAGDGAAADTTDGDAEAGDEEDVGKAKASAHGRGGVVEEGLDDEGFVAAAKDDDDGAAEKEEGEREGGESTEEGGSREEREWHGRTAVLEEGRSDEGRARGGGGDEEGGDGRREAAEEGEEAEVEGGGGDEGAAEHDGDSRVREDDAEGADGLADRGVAGNAKAAQRAGIASPNAAEYGDGDDSDGSSARGVLLKQKTFRGVKVVEKDANPADDIDAIQEEARRELELAKKVQPEDNVQWDDGSEGDGNDSSGDGGGGRKKQRGRAPPVASWAAGMAGEAACLPREGNPFLSMLLVNASVPWCIEARGDSDFRLTRVGLLLTFLEQLTPPAVKEPASGGGGRPWTIARMEEGAKCAYRTLVRKRLHERDPLLQQVVQHYARLHRRCLEADGDLGWKFAHEEELHCRYLLWEPPELCGLANRLVSLTSAFLYAILSGRVLLVHFPGADISGLLCNPFLRSSWHIPDSLGMEAIRQKGVRLESFRAAGAPHVDPKRIAERRPYVVKIDVSETAGEDDHRWLGCPKIERALAGVPYVHLWTNQHFAAGLYLHNLHRATLNALFPDRAALNRLHWYLLYPVDTVWERSLAIYKKELEPVAGRVGIQIRVLDNTWHPEVARHVLSCLINNDLLASSLELDPLRAAVRSVLPASATVATGTGAAAGKGSIALFVTCLRPEYIEHLQGEFAERSVKDRRLYSIVAQPAQEKEQYHSLEHWQVALVDIWTLAFSDVLLTSPFSTFGYMATALAGIRPYQVSMQVQEGTACEPAKTMEACYHFPPRSVHCSKHGPTSKPPDTSLAYLQQCQDFISGVAVVNKEWSRSAFS